MLAITILCPIPWKPSCLEQYSHPSSPLHSAQSPFSSSGHIPHFFRQLSTRWCLSSPQLERSVLLPQPAHPLDHGSVSLLLKPHQRHSQHLPEFTSPLSKKGSPRKLCNTIWGSRFRLWQGDHKPYEPQPEEELLLFSVQNEQKNRINTPSRGKSKDWLSANSLKTTPASELMAARVPVQWQGGSSTDLHPHCPLNLSRALASWLNEQNPHTSYLCEENVPCFRWKA